MTRYTWHIRTCDVVKQRISTHTSRQSVGPCWVKTLHVLHKSKAESCLVELKGIQWKAFSDMTRYTWRIHTCDIVKHISPQTSRQSMGPCWVKTSHVLHKSKAESCLVELEGIRWYDSLHMTLSYVWRDVVKRISPHTSHQCGGPCQIKTSDVPQKSGGIQWHDSLHMTHYLVNHELLLPWECDMCDL